MTNEFSFSIGTTRFDEYYSPSESSRITTNFANLARGEHRQQNLRNALTTINQRFNELARENNPTLDRYSVELEIISVDLEFTADDADLNKAAQQFPIIEVLDIQIVDQVTGDRTPGIVGNNFSSYIRDFDFSIVLPAANEGKTGLTVPSDFGDLHGKVFQRFLDSSAFRDRFQQEAPVICISVSTSRTYTQTETRHPVLGIEYQQDAFSLTDEYFAKMGLQVRYFMPAGSSAPLAFYHRGDLLTDHTDLQLAATIATMETFQKIYRPEVYSANSPAEATYQPTLKHDDFTRLPIAYDREERSQLAVKQGNYTAERFMQPHGAALEAWAAHQLVPAV